METLTPYQAKDVDAAWQAYARHRNYAPLFGDCGTGKTPVYITLSSRIAAERIRQGHRSPVTWLVTENTARQSQKEKIEKFDPRFQGHKPGKWDIIILEGNFEERELLLTIAMAQRSAYVICNYNQLALHVDTLMVVVSDDDVLIADECDLASPSGANESQRFEVAKAMACRVHYRIAATGSPIRNRVDTLYNLFLLCDPTWINWNAEVELGTRTVTMPSPGRSSFWGTKAEFLGFFGVFDGDRLVDIRRKELLHERLLEYGASLTSKDVLQIEHAPMKIHEHDLSQAQKVLYEHVKAGYADMIDAAALESARDGLGDVTLKNLLAQISYARYLVGLSPENFKRLVARAQVRQLDKQSAFALVNYLHLDDLVVGDGNARLDAVMQFLVDFDWDHEGGVLLYSQFKEVILELDAAIQKTSLAAKYGWGMITGSQTQAERDRVRLAVDSGKIRIVGISNAGGRSIDLIRLNHIVSLITPWTQSEESQALGRVDRYGQSRTVHHHYFAAKDCIETKHMLPLLGAKGKAADDVRSGKRGRRSHFEKITSAYQVVGWL